MRFLLLSFFLSFFLSFEREREREVFSEHHSSNREINDTLNSLVKFLRQKEFCVPNNLHSLGVPKKYFGRTPTWVQPYGKKMEKMVLKNKY